MSNDMADGQIPVPEPPEVPDVPEPPSGLSKEAPKEAANEPRKELPRAKWRSGTPASAHPAETAASVPGRSARLLALLALLLGSLAGVVALILYLRGVDSPDFLSLTIHEYSPPLPPNPQAAADGSLLKERFDKGRAEWPDTIQDGRGVSSKIRGLKEKGDHPVVVHICALARYRGGQVYLLGGAANPDQVDEDQWVKLSEIIDGLRACPAKRKLLILDIMREVPDERFGLFADDIAAKVQAALGSYKELPFYVLCACAAGQTSQTSEELGRSLFAHCLDEGLRGYADNYNPQGDADRQVSVVELANFVKQRVDRWAWKTRGARQTPVLLGRGADFPLVKIDSEDAEDAAELKPASAYPAWLKLAWTERDKLAPRLRRLAPVPLKDMEARLLRFEQRWRAGIDDKRLKTEWDSIPPPVVPPEAQTPAPPDKKKLPPAFADALGRLLLKAVLKASEPDKEKKEDAERDKKERKEIEEAFVKQPIEAALVLFDALAELPKLDPKQVEAAEQLLKGLPWEARTPRTVFVERLLAFVKHVRKEEWAWPAPAVAQALRATRAAEEALAAIAQEPSVLPWVSDLLTKADEARRANVQTLFTRSLSDWTELESALKAATANFERVKSRAESLRKAREIWDRAMALLPKLGPTLRTLPAVSELEKSAWQEAVSATRKVAGILAKPDASGEVDAALERASTVLERNLDILQDSAVARVKRCKTPDEDAAGETYLEMQAFLDGALLDASGREELWQARRKLGIRLRDEVMGLDKADNPGKPTVFVPQGVDRAAESRGAQQALRFQQAIDMIHLAGLSDIGTLETELQKAKDKADAEAWLALSEKLAEVWPGQLLAELKAGGNDSFKADRISRIVSPFDLDRDKIEANVTLTLYRRDLASLWDWLVAHYQADSAALENTLFRSVYRTWADECRQRVRMP
jgi:hypothetical protein